MEFNILIGLEVHAQVLTTSKMFCGCSADYVNAEPNTHVCPVCLGLPGALPVINQHAIDRVAETGLALNCTINQDNVISRKQYFYPDLPSNYQRTQYEDPICSGGFVEIAMAPGSKRIGITRVHMEEDTGKLLHVADGSLVDYNRAGVPLMEIVSEPDLATPEEARLYLQKLRQILVWLGVNSGNLEEGAFRCDANVSVKGTKVEVKNMNSFRSVERALQYEIERQKAVVEAGGRVEQETRGWDEDRGVTVGQRSKEYAHDYRYFPDPDIPPLQLDESWTRAREAALPELPSARRNRFIAAFQLSMQDAELLTAERSTADYFESAVAAAKGINPKAIANWITGELFRLLNDTDETLEAAAIRLRPEFVGEVAALVAEGVITGTVAKQVFEESFRTGRAPTTIVDERGLKQISDTGAIRGLAREAIANNPKVVADYRRGKTQSIKFLVGQVMRASKGQANPQLVEKLLAEELTETVAPA
ncbi:MAG TPA: Asp-tRNA(Asn)/Glu-tRNA(Gln) amidotransferase subunit GatB [Herpetosiphonaceae bacterium]|nr:Asp-tRNA(Asn)/Glu-tRNA(Gln) amidotransferase subunit GatB [Herpetosiphonaceae bacterium]